MSCPPWSSVCISTSVLPPVPPVPVLVPDLFELTPKNLSTRLATLPFQSMMFAPGSSCRTPLPGNELAQVDIFPPYSLTRPFSWPVAHESRAARLPNLDEP